MFSLPSPRLLTRTSPHVTLSSPVILHRLVTGLGATDGRPAPSLAVLTLTTPSGRRFSPSDDPLTPLINLDGVESATNELPLSSITFGSREEGSGSGAGRGRVGSWPRLERCTVWGAGRRQRHSIAGQMSYLKMLGLGARGKLPGAAGLFSTAVISGSSSAPNLRVMIPPAATTNSE